LYLIIDIVKEIHKKELTVEKLKDDLFEIYSKLTNNFTDRERINKIIDVLREEAQFDANQLQDGSMNFEQMIMQDGFIAVNFDLWLLLVNYKIPSIFISSKPIPETRFNFTEFVCYTEPDITNYVFILVPAMYRRKPTVLPEYRLVVNDNNDINININLINRETNCINNIENAIINYVTVDDYLDIIFEKDNTTKYKPRKKGIREQIEFVIDSAEPIQEDIKEPALKVKKLKVKTKVKKIKPTIILEEAEEAIENPQEEEIKTEEKNIFNINESFEKTHIKKRKTKRRREKKIEVNPPGRTGKKSTRKKELVIENPDFELVIE
jgi:hypothetical protein